MHAGQVQDTFVLFSPTYNYACCNATRHAGAMHAPCGVYVEKNYDQHISVEMVQGSTGRNW